MVYEYRLLQYSDNTSTYRKFTYLYDESGIVGVVYNNNGEEQTYHYSRNIKGDVIGIFDVNGAEIVKYSYDSWGNFEITTGSLTNIAKDNPILYRGYYYDHDTELYLLDARFYNPKWRRFISPDDTAYLDPDTPSGLNLYAYCNNDPVNYSDPSGNVVLSAILWGAAIGFAISFSSSLVVQSWETDEKLTWKNVDRAIFDGIFGAVNGALAATGIHWAISSAAGFLLGGLSSYLEDKYFLNTKFNVKKAFGYAIIGGISGAISGNGADNIAKGQHVTKYVHNRNILKKTIANGTKNAIRNQEIAMSVHSQELLFSGFMYLVSHNFSIFVPRLSPVAYLLR